ncbi:hypothetical protein CKO51_19210 [Rhodopirellula sp. SM50]|nr:hypothetical protein CKO51_19210 [Rhodopirellula sp. SM50]
MLQIRNVSLAYNFNADMEVTAKEFDNAAPPISSSWSPKYRRSTGGHATGDKKMSRMIGGS